MKPKKEFQVRDLTPRELEVLVLVGKGYSYGKVARMLQNKATDREGGEGVSRRTVEQYAARIRDLMEVPLSPAKALMIYYQSHREELEKAA